jgi:Putative zinc-finger
MSWHADVDSLNRYLADQLSEAHAGSVEAHLLACEVCRHELSRRAHRKPTTVTRHEESWERILEGLDQTRLTSLERVLVGCRVPPSVARLVAAAPVLRQAWLLGGTAMLAFAVLIAQFKSGTVGTVLFVVTAPVVPLIVIGLSYGARGEPAGEVAVVAPYRSFQLVVLRAVVVLMTWLPVAGILALALPSYPVAALLWFLPALALCSLTLAVSTFVDPLPAAAALVVTWLTAAGLAVRGPRSWPAAELLGQFIAFQPAGQALLGAVTVAAVVVTVVRRTAFDTWRAW